MPVSARRPSTGERDLSRGSLTEQQVAARECYIAGPAQPSWHAAGAPADHVQLVAEINAFIAWSRRI